MKSFFYLLFIMVNQITFGQDKVADSCSLKNNNIVWKNSFENEEKIELKMRMIREKIISDSIYTEFKPKIITSHSRSLYSETVDKNGNNCGVKILFILNYTKKKFIILDLNKNPEYIIIVEKLNDININKIYPIFDNNAVSLYGTYGKSGVVILTTENKKFVKEIKKNIKNFEHKKRKVKSGLLQ